MPVGPAERIFVLIAPFLLVIIESLLMIAAVALTFLSQRSPDPPLFRKLQRAFRRLARRKRLAVVVTGLSVLVARLALLPLLGVPYPKVHDEFSFLLAADTFAHGRLTNPTHPMWKYFESFHIIQHPTYMSMYPPAQGLMLAAGQILGHPWIGQLFATALMCSAICWMLQAWLPPPWALFGAFLAVLRIGVLSYWMNGYFAGSLTALAGALVLGALPRIWRHARLGDAIAMGLGVAVLANTRPFEGLVFCLPIAAALTVWLLAPKKIAAPTAFLRVILPLSLILGAAAVGMGCYFWRVTGNPFLMPYEVNRQTYAVAPYFIWGKLRPVPVYHHAVMRNFYDGLELHSYQSALTFLGFLRHLRHKGYMLWTFYAGPAFTIPFFFLPYLFRDRRMRFPLLLAAAVLFSVIVETWTSPHYVAAATGLFFLLLVQCLRHLCRWRWRGGPVGAGIVRAVPMVCLSMIVLRTFAAGAHVPIEAPWTHRNIDRSDILKELEAMPGQQLAIVCYSPSHSPHSEWVYNRADIDAAKVVWARDMGKDGNRELLQYFRGRKVWLVEADSPTPQLLPYPE
ncbi:MAG: hypothetical protein WAM69_19820 [Candidatus Sulfotelmatobacter sp.]